MIKHYYRQALLFGFCVGLACTFFDGIAILGSMPCCLPPDFMFILAGYNLLFWGAAGALETALLRWYIRTKRHESSATMELLSVWFFLVPFAVMYGVLGRIPVPHMTITHYEASPVFDYHLSFVWVACLLALRVLHARKNNSGDAFSPFTLFPDAAACMLIFQLCSNPCLAVRALRTSCGDRAAVFMYVFVLAAVFVLYAGFLWGVRNKLNAFMQKKYGKVFAAAAAVVAVVLYACIVCGYRHPHVACPETTMQDTADRTTPVIVIVLDALRADRLSMYHPGCVPQKNLEAFARDSLVFETCIAPCSWTLPSHASLFTGLHVSEHKCEFIISPLPILSPVPATMAEIFKKEGFRTAAIVSNFGWLDPKFGINRGFEIYNCSRSVGIMQSWPFRPQLALFAYITNVFPESIMAYRTADLIVGESVKLIEAFGGQPFFLFLNFLESHSPWFPPRPFDNLFADTTFPQMFRLRQYFYKLFKIAEKNTWDKFLSDQYDGEVAFLDEQLGGFFDYLKEKQLYDRALIVVTSDHGSMLGEHGEYEHHGHLYEEVAKVPLLIKFPFSKRVGRQSGAINLIDILPTVLSICDIPVPDAISGRPFGGPSSVVSEVYSFELGIHRVIYDGPYKLMQYQSINSHIPNKLFNLANDPLEEHNIIESYPDIASAMGDKLMKWEKNLRPVFGGTTEPQALLESTQENLRSLGYIQ